MDAVRGLRLGASRPEEVDVTETNAPYGSGPSAEAGPPVKRVRIHHLRAMKERGEKFAMLTAYDQYAAEIFDEAGIPVLLIGDSAANNVFGYETTLPVTVDELLPLVRAVSRAAPTSYANSYFCKPSSNRNKHHCICLRVLLNEFFLCMYQLILAAMLHQA